MANNIKRVKDPTELINNSDRLLLDVRPPEAYNGWTLRNERRGGHIKGASSFPASWRQSSEWPILLKNKGITNNKKIIVYSYEDQESRVMARALEAAGFENISVYDGFMDWSEDKELPMGRLPRFYRLVYPEWIKMLLDGKKPPEWHDGDYVICHASYRYREDYESGHIPGAIHMDTELLESSRDWNRRSPEDLKKALTGLGIRKNTTVILYGRFSHPNNEDEYPGRMAGHLAAMRCAQVLLYSGVEDVRILNGGMAAWNEAGYEVSTEEGVVTPVEDFGTDIPSHPELIIDTPRAKELLASDNGELVSIRSWEEFIGKVSGYNYIEKAGRIPGAVFGNCGSDAYHMENYRNHDHTMREYHEIARVWKESGIVPEKHIAFYCGTGWRASEAFFNAYFMGWPRISVYDGGWMEWSGDPGNPVENGIPKKTYPAWS